MRFRHNIELPDRLQTDVSLLCLCSALMEAQLIYSVSPLGSLHQAQHCSDNVVTWLLHPNWLSSYQLEANLHMSSKYDVDITLQQAVLLSLHNVELRHAQSRSKRIRGRLKLFEVKGI